MEQLLYSNEVILEGDRVIKLGYGIIEKISERDQITSYYGISVSKELEGIVETEKVDGISSSKEFVVDIIKKLCHFEVTPISMIEIVDELVTQAL